MIEKLTEVQETVFSSSSESIGQIVYLWPTVLAAIGVLVLGWLLSYLVGKFFVKLGEKARLNYVLDKIGFSNLLKKAKIKSPPSLVIGRFFQGWIITVFLLGTANILQLDPVSDFLTKIIDFLPNILVALLIMLFAFRMGDFVGAIVNSVLSATGSHGAKVLSMVIKGILIAFGVLAALVELNIAPELMQILFTGFIFMIGLAGGLAFGLGGKDVVREFLEDLRDEKKNKQKK